MQLFLYLSIFKVSLLLLLLVQLFHYPLIGLLVAPSLLHQSQLRTYIIGQAVDFRRPNIEWFSFFSKAILQINRIALCLLLFSIFNLNQIIGLPWVILWFQRVRQLYSEVIDILSCLFVINAAIFVYIYRSSLFVSEYTIIDAIIALHDHVTFARFDLERGTVCRDCISQVARSSQQIVVKVLDMLTCHILVVS